MPESLLERATRKGEGITEVVRSALEFRASQQACQRVAGRSGKVRGSVSLEELRED